MGWAGVDLAPRQPPTGQHPRGHGVRTRRGWSPWPCGEGRYLQSCLLPWQPPRVLAHTLPGHDGCCTPAKAPGHLQGEFVTGITCPAAQRENPAWHRGACRQRSALSEM